MWLQDPIEKNLGSARRTEGGQFTDNFWFELNIGSTLTRWASTQR